MREREAHLVECCGGCNVWQIYGCTVRTVDDGEERRQPSQSMHSERQRRSRQDQNKPESRDFGEEKVGGMSMCIENNVLVMVLTEMRSTIEYYVLRYTQNFLVEFDFLVRELGEGFILVRNLYERIFGGRERKWAVK